MKVQPTDPPPPAHGHQQARALILPVLTVLIPALISLVWGLSWALGDYPECGGGSYFLADLGWAVAGMFIGLITGIVLPIVVTARRGWTLAVVLLVAAGIAMVALADAGATQAARLVGCDPWYVREAGQAIGLGLALGGIPTAIVTGIITALRGSRRDDRDSWRPVGR